MKNHRKHMNVISPWIITILKLKFRNKGSECMSRFTLDDYYGQRRTLTTAISQQETKKTELEGKIRRLEKASSSLQTQIEAIEESYKKIADLTIDEGRWRGAEK